MNSMTKYFAPIPHVVFTTLLIAAATLVQIDLAYADSKGIVDRSGARAGRDCTGCHTAGAAVPTVTISGPTTVAPGSINQYTVKITGGAAATAAAGVTGIDVSATNGMLAVAPGTSGTIVKLNSRNVLGEFVHSSATPFSANGVSYAFQWTAPATAGTTMFYAAGLSANGDKKDGAGDGTGLATLSITVGGGTGTPGPTPTPAPTTAKITGPQTSAAGVAVNFSAATSTGTINTFNWNFGDGTAGAGVTVSHTFTAGTFTVSLTVIDSAGVSATSTQNIVVAAAGTNLPPVADAGGPYADMIGVPVQFDGSASSDPDGIIISYAWDFGDSATSNRRSPTHTYAAPGEYVVTLTVVDNSNASMTATTAASITDPSAPNPGPTNSQGESLYMSNCEECHGPGGAGTAEAPAIVNATPQDIEDAIANVDVMQSLAGTLDPMDIENIAHFLKTGRRLYAENCEECHGRGGRGTAEAPPITDVSPQQIIDAIEIVPEMQSLIDAVDALDIEKIAMFLRTGQGLYGIYCEECHGPAGIGTAEAPPIVNVTSQQIEDAIANVPEMELLIGVLTTRDIDNITAYLAKNEAEEDSIRSSLERARNSIAANAAHAQGTVVVSNKRVAANGSTDWLVLLMLGALGLARKQYTNNQHKR